MWLIVQIMVGVTLAFLALALVVALWWHWWGQWCFVRLKGTLWSAIEFRVHRAVHTALGRDVERFEQVTKNFRDSMEDSGAAISEGLHQNAQAGRVIGTAAMVSVVVPLVVTLAEHLFRRRQ